MSATNNYLRPDGLFCLPFLLCSLNLSCTETPRAVAGDSFSRDTVTFIFDGFPLIEREVKFGDGTRLRVDDPDVLVHDGDTTIVLKPKVGLRNDTIAVRASGATIVLSHKINVFESVEYVFHRGDTVVFTYMNGNTLCKVLNRKTPAEEFRWSNEFRKSSGTGQYSYRSKYFFPAIVANSINIPDGLQLRNTYYPLYKNELISEGRFLDSLSMSNSISEESYDYFKDRVKYSLLSLDLMNDQLSEDDVKAAIAEYDSLETYSYSNFTDFVDLVVARLFNNRTKLINIGNGFTRDYRASFDDIQRSPLFSKELKDKILFKQLTAIASHFSLSDFNAYYEKFRLADPDKALLRRVRDIYLIDLKDLRTSSEGIQLITGSKKRASLSEIISHHKGKLVYVDFWASWCGPCRQAMPASTKLRAEYHDKVVFVYLSSDRNFEKWMAASKDEGIELYHENYLMVNVSHSDFLASLEFKEIPRYIVFDQLGRLIHRNAPGPNSDEIKEIFKEHLSN